MNPATVATAQYLGTVVLICAGSFALVVADAETPPEAISFLTTMLGGLSANLLRVSLKEGRRAKSGPSDSGIAPVLTESAK